MFKKDVSKKNAGLCSLIVIIGIVSMCLIALSSSIIRTLLILIGAVSVILFIGKKLGKINKSK